MRRSPFRRLALQNSSGLVSFTHGGRSVVRGEIDSVTGQPIEEEPEDPNVIPYNSASVHPLAIAGTDFQFANRAAFIADITAQFPDDSIPGDYPYDTSMGTLETRDGRKVWRMPESIDSVPTGFSVSKLITGPQRIFLRTKVYIPPSPPAWLVSGDKFSPEVTGGGTISNGPDYSYYLLNQNAGCRSIVDAGAGLGEGGMQGLDGDGSDPTLEFVDPPFWTPRLQGKTTDWLLLLETGANPAVNPVRARFWLDGGTALQDAQSQVVAAADAWNLLVFQPALTQLDSLQDAVNNFIDYKLIEFVPWAPATPCPYSGITT